MFGSYDEAAKDLIDLYGTEKFYETFHVLAAPSGGIKLQMRVNGTLMECHTFTRTEAVGLRAMLDEALEHSKQLMEKEMKE